MSKFSVPDMSCAHCRAAITEALKPLGGEPHFDMERREIEVDGLGQEQILAALQAIGFPATPK